MRALIPVRRKLMIKALLCVGVLAASSFTLARSEATAATPFRTVQPGTFKGYGFDACTAPSSETMQAWRTASPYRAIGIYFGGNNRGCTQKNLTADWVREQVTAGWKLLPLYVGPQAACRKVSSRKILIDNADAEAQGRLTASDAVVQATALGLAPQSVLIYDLEAYPTGDAACRRGVLAFMKGWTSRLHDLGYLSGFYSSVSSGVADQVANYAKAGYVRPDYLDFARWDNVETVSDPKIPDTAWSPRRRMKQYRGGHQETWGGVTINIDNDYVDFAMLPSATFADFNGNSWSDVLVRNSVSGFLHIYPGNGSTVSPADRRKLSAGWKSMNAIVRIGDLNKDGHEDVVARHTNGKLWFYPGTGSGFARRTKLATKWGRMREITAIGDLNNDGYPDLLAIQKSNNKLYLYPGRPGAKLGARSVVSGGWKGRSELAGTGDFNRDGFPDLVARNNANGVLHLYHGRKGGFSRQRRIGTGWSAMRSVVGVGDFDRDGYVDLAAIRKRDSGLMLYRGTGKTLTAGVRLTVLGGSGLLL